jgi:hypothetical protein
MAGKNGNGGKKKSGKKAAGIDPSKLKESIKRFLPVVKAIAKITPNTYDDMVVTFLETTMSAPDDEVTAACEAVGCDVTEVEEEEE